MTPFLRRLGPIGEPGREAARLLFDHDRRALERRVGHADGREEDPSQERERTRADAGRRLRSKRMVVGKDLEGIARGGLLGEGRSRGQQGEEQEHQRRRAQENLRLGA